MAGRNQEFIYILRGFRESCSSPDSNIALTDMHTTHVDLHTPPCWMFCQEQHPALSVEMCKNSTTTKTQSASFLQAGTLSA